MTPRLRQHRNLLHWRYRGEFGGNPPRGLKVHSTTPAPGEQPGAYALQMDSYRNLDDAERLRAKVSMLGIDARSRLLAIDADKLHRVLISQIRDLPKLNAALRELRAAGIDAIICQVGE